MTEETLRLVLQIIAVFVGGSAVQLLIFLIRRRAEVRQLDTSSDVSLLGAAQSQIKQYVEVEEKLRATLADREARYAELENRLVAERAAHARALTEAEQTNSQLSADLARARSELSTCRFQLAQMDPQNRPGRGRGNWEGA